MKDCRVLLITNIPTPYRIPFFNEIHRLLRERGSGLFVVFGAKSYSRRRWVIDLANCRFDYRLLNSPKITFGDYERTMFTYSGLWSVVNDVRPSLIISSGFSAATTALWLRSFVKKTRYMIWSGATVRSDRSDFWMRRIQRKLLVRKAAGFIVYGKKAEDYLKDLDAPSRKIVTALNTVDTDFFLKKTRQRRVPNDSTGKKTLLSVGYFSKRKRFDQVISAAYLLSRKRSDFVLQLVGDGPEKENLQSLVDALRLQDCVSFEGFKQKDELASYLENADGFLFPTDFDIWGLVLIEAMAVGLPCIASVHSGAAHDLIVDGVNGFIADYSNSAKVIEKIEWILDQHAQAFEMGMRAKDFISRRARVEDSARAFVEAIDNALV
jgi:glycosyltransferase involved in cell wall biosynthesis